MLIGQNKARALRPAHGHPESEAEDPVFLFIGALLLGEKILSLVVRGLNYKFRAGDLPFYQQDTSHLSHLPTGRGGRSIHTSKVTNSLVHLPPFTISLRQLAIVDSFVVTTSTGTRISSARSPYSPSLRRRTRHRRN